MKVTRIAPLVALPLAALALTGCSGFGQDPPMATVTVTAVETATPDPIVVTQAPEPDPSKVLPTDVTIALTVVEKQCFGSAGCSVTVEPALTTLTDAASAGGYRVTFEISGDESGTVVSTLTVLTTGEYSYDTIYMSTPNNETVPAATVTAIRPGT